MTQRRSTVVVKERQHDYLYDPVYTLSGIRDHERVMRKSVTQLGKLEKLFNFQNLFSEVSFYKPYRWRINPKDPVPDHVNREFNAQDVCNDLMKRLISGNNSFDDLQNVIGRERAKFFAHHRVYDGRFPSSDMVQVDMAIEALGHGRLIATEPIGVRGPTFVSRAIQTVYRDSEAQTDPYTPPYVVNVGETPEVLTLATLGYGKGLPAGLHDVEMIERARERRLIENSLEPYSEIAYDPKRVERRRKILQDLELREWHFREQEVEALQEVRMKVLVQLLRKREEHEQEAASRRLDRMWEERCAIKEAQCKKIQHQFVTAIRKLMRKRLAERRALREKGRDVIRDYSDPSSQSFAPLTRLGVFPDRASEANVVKSFYLNTYEGLLELEQSLPSSCLKTNIRIKPIQMYTKEGYLRGEFRNQQELAKLQQYLDDALNPKKRARRKPRFLEKIQRAPPRPVTPSIAPPRDESVLERELAAVTLQQLIRGRAIQTQMYEGKEKRKELIEELRSTHALLEDEIAEKRRQKRLILGTQNQHAELLHRDNEMDNILGHFECGSLADMLDFLSKELDRLIEERRIHALVLLAERHRRMREAEESGNRQQEERRRREQDEVFKQIVKLHQETVDGYLASVAGVAIDTTADTIAQKEVDELAIQVDTRACDLEEKRDAKLSELIAADLVHNFLIPEVNRCSYQAMLEKRQRPLLLAAHREIWNPAHSAARIEPLPKNKMSFRLDVSTMTSDRADVTLSKPSFTEHTGPNEATDTHSTFYGD